MISDGVAYTVDQAIKGPLESGTAAGQGIQCPAGGKTGTTEQQSDAWFVGYHAAHLDRGLDGQPG